MDTKKCVVFFKATFAMHQYTWNYVYNPLKYQKTIQ